MRRDGRGPARKKLRGAALRLCGLTAAAPAEAQALLEAGADAELAALLRAEEEAREPPALDADEAAACELFAVMQTQWRRAEGLPAGLDYAALPAAAQLAEIEITPERFRCLRFMEGVAAEAIRKRAAARRPGARG